MHSERDERREGGVLKGCGMIRSMYEGPLWKTVLLWPASPWRHTQRLVSSLLRPSPNGWSWPSRSRITGFMEESSWGKVPPDVDVAMRPTYDVLADSLYEKVRELPAERQLWVACAGAPGSGKTALTLQVARRLQEKGVSTAVVPMDGYHYYRCELDAMETAKEMHRKRGAIFTFNAERFVKDLKVARECREGVFPSFDHKEKDPREGQIKVLWVHKSDRIVLVEGNYVMVFNIPPWGELQGIFDEKWYISCQPEAARARVIARHMGTGLTQVEATYRVDDNDTPNGALIDKESRPYATRIIPSL